MLRSTNWAGNVAVGGGYSYVASNYFVPCVNNSTKAAIASQWVGLGGNGSGGGNLVQTGTDSAVSPTGSISYYAWYEDYPNGPNQNLTWKVSCGDYMFVEVTSDGCANDAYSYVEDYTSGNYTGHCYGSSQPNGSSAEWIVERPGYPNGTLYHLANFSSTEAQFLYCATDQNGHSYTVGSSNHTSVTMYNTAGTELANPGPITNGGQDFTVYFDHS